MSILDHIGFAVSDFPASRAFYEKALAPLGIKVLMDVTAEMTGGPAYCGFGEDKPDFWIGEGKAPEHRRMLPLQLRTGRSSMPSTRLRSQPVARITAHRACGRSTTKITTVLSYSTRMV